MTLLDRYLSRRLVATLFKILLALVLLFIVIDLLTHRQDDIGKYQVPARVVSLYYLTYVPVILFEYQAAALAMLVAGLMVLGRAAQDREVTAALAGGVSLRRLVRMPVLIALLLALTAFAAEQTLGIRAAAVSERIEDEYFTRFSADARGGISWTNLSGGWTCHVLKFNRDALTGQDVFIHSMKPELVREIRAHRMYWEPGQRQWILEDGRSFTLYPDAEMRQQVEQINQAPAPFDEPPEQLFALEQPASTKSAWELRRDLRQAARLGLPVARHWVDYYVKFARPALCFVMVWLAIPFAIRLRRGGIAIGFGVSIGIALAYMLLFFAGIGLGHLGKLPPVAAAWLANAVFLAFGMWLFHRTPT